MSKTKLTAEEKNYVIELREKGISLNQIVIKIRGKVSPQRVDQIHKDYLLKNYKLNKSI